MIKAPLWFRRTDVLELAEHAIAAPEHRQAYGDESPVGTPSLIWVKDDGIYLLSNGLPNQPRTDTDPPTNKMHVVYAHGHGPGTHWDHGAPLGDDFVEYLTLTEPDGDDSTSLLGLLRNPDDPAKWLVLTAQPDTVTIELSGTGPS
ncbi:MULTISPECIES: DUF3085 domain-containing protein [Nocardia]|uniref:DUF3085 domain-containing protein n=1 Tax=Nocardia TaxID=1817 RepID=UPI0002DA34F3|nr:MULTISPECIES: DUF3085 domain-containing protein [Nocardia]